MKFKLLLATIFTLNLSSSVIPDYKAKYLFERDDFSVTGIRELKNLDKDWHFTRIESSTVNGIPDVHCVVNRQVFWIELKANTSKNCGLSKYQINWHIKYLKAGGRAYILNRPLLQAPFELLAVNRESRTAVPLSRHTDLKTLITFASQLGPRGSSREA